ncbi:MAG: hypothetical protein JWP16_2120 [Alphaproteobacteria bacterium]|nr:hypothetical protein [Alphaproteobacteria bacterium]
MRKMILVMLALPQAAFAWGYMGHKIIGEVAARNFPDEIPAFLRGPEAAAELGILSQEPDTSRNAGQPHDYDLDPGHFLDVSDDLTILGGPKLSALPASRRDYDTALRAVGVEQYKAGFLPYNILDGYQQLVKDFALLRATQASVKNAAKFKLGAADRRDLARLLAVRKLLTRRDLGYWAHFVEDASQPMHVSIHYDGWGDGPNPQGFTILHGIHARFESAFVNANITEADVEARMRPYQPCTAGLQVCLQDYLATVAPLVTTAFELDKAGALEVATPQARDFVAIRLADGASHLRDMVVDAWREAGDAQLGYKIKTPVADYESGKAIMTPQSKD